MKPVLGDGFVHISCLKFISLSAAHYRVAAERRLHPTPAMHFGSVVHAVLLGGEELMVWEGTRREKGYKRFAEENADRLIATHDEHERALLIAEAVRRDPVAAPLLFGEHERTIEWRYRDRDCSSRLDIITPVPGEPWNVVDIADLKTCASSEPIRLIRACQSLGYHAQLAFYERAAASEGLTVRTARIIAAETKPPFNVTVVPLTRKTLDAGAKLYHLWMERLLACEAADHWPGYVQSEFAWDLDEMETGALEVDGGDGIEAA